MPAQSTSHFAIVLAAGRSSRMGQEKARLPWLDGQNLLSWTLTALRAAHWCPLVVVGPESFHFWQTELGPERVVLNPQPELGKTTSLAAGIQRIPTSAEWILLTSVDQPRLPSLYRHLHDATAQPHGQIFVPDRAGRRGHPVVIAASLAPELLALAEDSLGLRGWLDAHDADLIRLLGHAPESLNWDLNTPEAYSRALPEFREQLAATSK